MSVEYTKKTWYDGSEGGTPITAAELNRVETGIDDVVTQSNADKTNIDNHIASKVNSSSGAHGLRYYSDKLDYYDETNEQWVEIQTGGGSADEVSYDNTDSGLSATNVQDAIDEVLSNETTVTTDSYGYVITDPKNTHVTIPPASLSGTASMAVKSGTQGKQYTMVDSENHVSADFYTKSAVDELVSGGGGTGNYPDLTNKPSINGVELLGNKLVGLLSTDIHINADKIGYSGTVSGASTTKAAIDALQSSLSGLHGIPSGGNTNQVLAKNSSSDYDLKWVNQTGGGGVGTVVNLTTTTTSFHNKTVTLTGTYATYSAVFDNTGHASVNVYYVGTYDIACEGFHNSVNVTAMGLVLTQGIDEDYCTVNLSSSDSALEGATCTIYFGDPTDDDVRQVTVVDSTLAFSFRATQIGSYTMISQYGGGSVTTSTTFTVSSLSGSMNVTIQSVPLKTFAAATDEEIALMVQAADAGLIDLYDDCGWRVGQERTVHLSAMSATGVGESHVAQDVTLVLMNKGGKILNAATASGRTTCSFVVGLKDCLKEIGSMGSSNTNVGGWTSCARRIWCNNIFKGAIPSTLSPIFKQFKNKTSAGNQSTVINTDVDWFALPSEIEIFGSTTYSFSGEGTQFTWYETAANRIKKVNGSATSWWGRSPYINDTAGFCVVDGGGSADAHSAAIFTCGIAPFGVI